MASDWLVWQLADSAFPTGGFAHSGGLEAAYQGGQVRGRVELGEFIEAALAQSGRSQLPFVRAAFEEPDSFAKIDKLCEAFTTNHVANRASRLQGRAFLQTAEKSFGLVELKQWRAHILAEDLPSHFAPVFGAVAKLLGLELTESLRLFLFGQLRMWISSAVRLGITGPMDAQNLQNSLGAKAEVILQRSKNLEPGDIATTAPILDLFQGMQDRLYSRLFQS